jgi:hypothetical protein
LTGHRLFRRGGCAAIFLLGACAPAERVPTAAPSAPGVAEYGTPPGDVEPFLGSKRITVLVVRSDSNPLYTDSAFRAQAVAMAGEMRKVMSANAAGRLQLSFSIVGPLRLPRTVCDTVTWENTPNQHSVFAAAVAASDSLVDYSTVRDIMVIYQGHGCLTGHTGTRRRLWGIFTDEGEVDASMSFVSGLQSVPLSLIPVHEFTHTIGATHGEPIACVVGGARVLVHHGDHFAHMTDCAQVAPWYTLLDPMGIRMHHFTAHHKIRWGWIAPTEVKSATTGLYPIYPTEGPHRPGYTKALRVPVKSYYYHSFLLEYRSAKAPLVDDPYQVTDQVPGVYLLADWSTEHSATADLIEPLDGSESLTEFRTKPLPVGVPVVDVMNGLTILVESVTATKATVRITRGGI